MNRKMYERFNEVRPAEIGAMGAWAGVLGGAAVVLFVYALAFAI